MAEIDCPVCGSKIEEDELNTHKSQAHSDFTEMYAKENDWTCKKCGKTIEDQSGSQVADHLETHGITYESYANEKENNEGDKCPKCGSNDTVLGSTVDAMFEDQPDYLVCNNCDAAFDADVGIIHESRKRAKENLEDLELTNFMWQLDDTQSSVTCVKCGKTFHVGFPPHSLGQYNDAQNHELAHEPLDAIFNISGASGVSDGSCKICGQATDDPVEHLKSVHGVDYIGESKAKEIDPMTSSLRRWWKTLSLSELENEKSTIQGQMESSTDPNNVEKTANTYETLRYLDAEIERKRAGEAKRKPSEMSDDELDEEESRRFYEDEDSDEIDEEQAKRFYKKSEEGGPGSGPQPLNDSHKQALDKYVSQYGKDDSNVIGSLGGWDKDIHLPADILKKVKDVSDDEILSYIQSKVGESKASETSIYGSVLDDNFDEQYVMDQDGMYKCKHCGAWLDVHNIGSFSPEEVARHHLVTEHNITESRAKEVLDDGQKSILRNWVEQNKDWSSIDDLPNEIFIQLVSPAGDDTDKRVEIQTQAIDYMKGLESYAGEDGTWSEIKDDTPAEEGDPLELGFKHNDKISKSGINKQLGGPDEAHKYAKSQNDYSQTDIMGDSSNYWQEGGENEEDDQRDMANDLNKPYDKVPKLPEPWEYGGADYKREGDPNGDKADEDAVGGTDTLDRMATPYDEQQGRFRNSRDEQSPLDNIYQADSEEAGASDPLKKVADLSEAENDDYTETCPECGKVFDNPADAGFHAVKHDTDKANEDEDDKVQTGWLDPDSGELVQKRPKRLHTIGGKSVPREADEDTSEYEVDTDEYLKTGEPTQKLPTDKRAGEASKSDFFWVPEGSEQRDFDSADKIMTVAGDIWDKHGWGSGPEVDKSVYEPELKAALSGVPITKKAMQILENENYHTEYGILVSMATESLDKNWHTFSIEKRVKLFEAIGLTQADSYTLAGLDYRYITEAVKKDIAKEERYNIDLEDTTEYIEDEEEEKEKDETDEAYEFIYNLEENHRSRDFKKKNLTCTRCNESFYSSNDRNVHFNDIHMKALEYELPDDQAPEECPFCNQIIREPETLDWHMSEQHGAHIPSTYTQTGIQGAMADTDDFGIDQDFYKESRAKEAENSQYDETGFSWAEKYKDFYESLSVPEREEIWGWNHYKANEPWGTLDIGEQMKFVDVLNKREGRESRKRATEGYEVTDFFTPPEDDGMAVCDICGEKIHGGDMEGMKSHLLEKHINVMNESKKRANEVEQAEVSSFLDELRESGATNMFGAGQFVEKAFGLSKEEARGFVTYWMENFGNESKKKVNESRATDLKKEIKKLTNFINIASIENPMNMGDDQAKLDSLKSELASLGESRANEAFTKVSDFFENIDSDFSGDCKLCGASMVQGGYAYDHLENKHGINVSSLTQDFTGESYAKEEILDEFGNKPVKGQPFTDQAGDKYIPSGDGWFNDTHSKLPYEVNPSDELKDSMMGGINKYYKAKSRERLDPQKTDITVCVYCGRVIDSHSNPNTDYRGMKGDAPETDHYFSGGMLGDTDDKEYFESHTIAKELYGQDDPEEILGGSFGTPEDTANDLYNMTSHNYDQDEYYKWVDKIGKKVGRNDTGKFDSSSIDNWLRSQGANNQDMIYDLVMEFGGGSKALETTGDID